MQKWSIPGRTNNKGTGSSITGKANQPNRNADYIDEDCNMIRLNLIYAYRYPHNANQEKYHYHSVAIETVYKVQYLGENVLFDANLESSFHNMISDIHYQAMKDEEPIAMAIYSYSDN